MVRLNEQLLLYALGVLQPASPDEVVRFLKKMFPQVSELSVSDVQPIFERWSAGGQAVRVHAKLKLYALSAKGNHLMGPAVRRKRDKARIFLLKEAHVAKVRMSGDGSKRWAGDSPAVDSSSGIQGARPISTSAVTLRGAPLALNAGRAYWPRVIKQLNVGSDRPSSDTFFDLYSYPSVRSLGLVSDRPAGEMDLSITDLGLAIGVSPRLLTAFIHRPQRHYRQFTIPKRSGGVRVISSPRVFLKVVQYWLVDYILWELPQHPCSHAYQLGCSIITNATTHVGKRYVANVDIEDFFPSVRWEAVAGVLQQHGFGPQLASAIARLSSLNGLPQGAPTSPVLSNAFMYDVDESISAYCRAHGLAYSRYADDITFSGDDRDAIDGGLIEVEKRLAQKHLSLNVRKTRIASQAGQQRVTGVVVNKKAQPPRKFRRLVRAMLHQAALNPSGAEQRLLQLRGYVSYLRSFPTLRDSPDIERYRTVLSELAKSFK